MSTRIINNLFYKNFKVQKRLLIYSQRPFQKNILFTKTGDLGKTAINKEELYKDHLIFEAIGATEELNACLGVAKEFVREDQKLLPLEEKIQKIQMVLIDVIDILGNLQPKSSSVDTSKIPNPQTTAKVSIQDITELETLIDYYGTMLPPVEKVVIPGGGKASATLHLAKTVCRRCERVLVTVFKDMEYDKKILTYFNRLSSYLSQASRICAKFANRSEMVYRPQLKGGTTTADK